MYWIMTKLIIALLLTHTSLGPQNHWILELKGGALRSPSCLVLRIRTVTAREVNWLHETHSSSIQSSSVPMFTTFLWLMKWMKPKVFLCIFHESSSRNVLASDINLLSISIVTIVLWFYFWQPLETEISQILASEREFIIWPFKLRFTPWGFCKKS